MDLLTKIGSISGLVSLIFLVWDRFMTGQPLVWPARRPLFDALHILRCMNVSKWDILITSIKLIDYENIVKKLKRSAIIARYDSIDGVADAADHDASLQALLPAGETREFPMGTRGGDSPSEQWFLIIVSWRSARSTGLPKLPVFVRYVR